MNRVMPLSPSSCRKPTRCIRSPLCRVDMYKDKMLEEIAILFGGRIAEEIFMHQMSTGASNDFERATKLARAMVTRYGMSETLGTMVYEDSEQDAYFGRMSAKTVSEATQQ